MENYKYTFDIQALDLVIQGHLNKINEEQRRLTFVSSQVQKRRDTYETIQSEVSDKKSQIIVLEKTLFAVDEKLQRSSEHASMATNEQQARALEKEINELSPKKDQLEEEILNLIDEVENLEEKIKEDDIYFDGVNQTLAEIQEDIDSVTKDHTTKIDKLNDQIEGLLTEIPDNIKRDFINSRNINRFKEPVVIMKAQSCAKCRMQMSSLEADNIMKRGDYLVCKGCSRVIVSPKTI